MAIALFILLGLATQVCVALFFQRWYLRLVREEIAAAHERRDRAAADMLWISPNSSEGRLARD